MNQDSLNKVRMPEFPLKNMYHFSYVNDTVRCIAYYTVTSYNEYILDGKKRRVSASNGYPVLLKTNSRLKLLTWELLYKDTFDIENLDTGLPFAYAGNNYYFPDVMTFVMKNPGAKQLRAYTERNGRFYSIRKKDRSLPLSEALVKKMGYTDTTVRNLSGPQPKGNDDFTYTMRTIDNHAYFCNKFQLIDVTANKEIFDGLENDFTIQCYTVDTAFNYVVLAQVNDVNKFYLKMFNKNIQLMKEQEIVFEANETVIRSDMKENKLVFIVQKNEKLYFKIYSITL